jgi:hypothetical protein
MKTLFATSSTTEVPSIVFGSDEFTLVRCEQSKRDRVCEKVCRDRRISDRRVHHDILYTMFVSQQTQKDSLHTLHTHSS